MLKDEHFPKKNKAHRTTLIPGVRESEGCYLGLWEVFRKNRRIMQSLEKNNKVNNQCFESDYGLFCWLSGDNEETEQ